MALTDPQDDLHTIIPTAMIMVTNSTNVTEVDGRLAMLKTMNSVFSTAALVVLMVMMGCAIELKDVKEAFLRPVGFAIGMTSQFVLMPLICFCLALAFQLDTAGALSLLILGCCPGGTLSNIFTYWCDGDISLSVSMTTVSSAAAIGMMPLNLFIYSRVWTDEGAEIPYMDIVITLFSICIPVVFGVLLRYFRKKWAELLKKICSFVVILVIGCQLLFIFLINPNFYEAEWGLWVAGVILPLVGYSFGYVFAYLLRQSHRKCRAIAFETGSQNVALALALTNTSFADSPIHLDMLFLPTIYIIFVYIDSFVVVGVYRFYVWRHPNEEESSNNEVDGTTSEKGNTEDGKISFSSSGKTIRGSYEDDVHGTYRSTELGEMEKRKNGVVESESSDEKAANTALDDVVLASH